MVGKKFTFLATAAFAALGVPAIGQVRITEVMYNGKGVGDVGEFVEFTNVGVTPIDMTGWSFDDNGRVPGAQGLSAFGIVAPGQSVILTDVTAAAFATNWSLAPGVVVIGGNTNNLGRNDEVNLYDNTTALVDRHTYNDQVTPPGGPRTNGTSAWTCGEWLGANQATQWTLSVVADAQGSYTSLTGTPPEIGNPGSYVSASPPCTCGNGVVDANEQCDGGSCCNDACDFVAGGPECRASTGPCDPAESCDGVSGACPADGQITTCTDGDGCCPVGCDGNNDDDCPPVVVPTVSEWGLAVLTLIGLIAGTVMFTRAQTVKA